MEKAIIPLIIFLIILAGAISVLSYKLTQDKEIHETHSYTKAICNSTNHCQDYVINCNREGIIGMHPITGAAVQFPETWGDPRDESLRNSFCN